MNRASVGSLSLKRRSAGLSVLDILNRKKNIRVAAVLVSGLLSDSDVSDDVNESENEQEDDDAENVNDDVLETVGYVFLKKVIEVDRPMVISMKQIAPKDVRAADYSDELC